MAIIKKPSAIRTASCTKRRRVCFEPEVKVITLQPVDESIKSELFYARSDFRRFKKESKRIEKMLNARLNLGSSFSGTSSSSRHRSLSLASFRLR